MIRKSLFILIGLVVLTTCSRDWGFEPPPPESLIAYYPFNGNANDESGNGNHATLLGGASITDKLIIGDNAGDRLSLPHTIMNDLNDFSFSMLLRIFTPHSPGSNYCISGANSSVDNIVLLGYIADSNSWRIYVNGKFYDISENISLQNKGWHHTVFVRNKKNIRLYINGELLGDEIEVDDEAINVESGGLILGQDQDGLGGQFNKSQSWAGEIDEVRFYDRAVSSQEVAALYSLDIKEKSSVNPDTMLVIDDGLVAYYPFNHNGAEDISGNDNHGTAIGATLVDNILVLGDNATDRFQLRHETINGLIDFSFTANLRIFTAHSGDTGLNTWISGATASEDNQLLVYYKPRTNQWRIGLKNIVYNFAENTAINDRDWHHIVITKNRSMAKLFVDGAQVGDGVVVDSSAINIASDGLFLGQDQDALGGGFVRLNSWAGEVDNFRIYNRTLTASEVNTLFEADKK